jgi:tetratricopeptide (TPR) repeat protein
MAYVAIALLTGFVFERVRVFDFVAYDDPKYVSDNVQVMAGLEWSSIRWAFTTVFGPYWHPLTLLSHMATVELFGLNAGPHHAINVFLHLANAMLLFGVLRRMTGAPGRSFVVAAIFAVHPLQVESVAWVTQRLNVLSTLFFLLTVWAYQRFAAAPGRSRYALILVFYACGLMSKPTLMALPVVLLLLDVWPLQRGWRVKEKLPLFGMAALAALGTLVYETRHGSVSGFDVLPLGERIANAFIWYATYLGRLFWPVHLSPFYPYPDALAPWWVIGGAAAVVLGISALAMVYRRRVPYLFVGWCWFVVLLAPTIGLVQAADQATADRFTYVAQIGIAVAVVWGAADVLTRARLPSLAGAGTAGVAIVVFAVAARAQTMTWRDTTSLWAQAVQVRPDSHRAQAALAEALSDADRAAEALSHFENAIRLAPGIATYRTSQGIAYERARNVPAAIDAYRAALRLDPDSATAHTNLGHALAAAGQLDEAMAAHQRALAIDPALAPAHVNLASVLVRTGRIAEALTHVDTATRLAPRLAGARALRGTILQLTGQPELAIAEYEAAIALDPTVASTHSNLAGALLGRGDLAGAERAYRRAISLDPALADAHNGLGVTLLKLGRLDEAVARHREAVRLHPGSISARNNLGIALGHAGDRAGARREFAEVLRLDPSNQTALAAIRALDGSR